MITLPASCTVIDDDETYAAAYVGHRPGGGVDVVVSRTPHDTRFSATYLVMRHDPGQEWRRIAGRWTDLDQAVQCGCRELRYAVVNHAALAELLAPALGEAA